ncbi:MAG: metallophosphoesterase [Bryobacter sp.]|nr:metallophosphoesterase [Bryobacter sp.]
MKTAAILLLFAVAAFGQSFFFLQMTDPQFGMYTGNESFEQETANLEFAIATANRLRPAFVVITGDLINKPLDKAQTDEYLRITGKLDKGIKLYHVSGNHDVENSPTPQSLAAWRARHGADYYTFRHEGFVGVVLNSTLMHMPERARAEDAKQMAWLKETLAKLAAEKPMRLVVFLHHPLFVKSATEADGYHSLPKERRWELLDLFEKHGIQHVFAGHAHHNAGGEHRGLQMVVTGPVGKPLGDPQGSGFRVVRVTPSTLEHKYYPLSLLPHEIVAAEPLP